MTTAPPLPSRVDDHAARERFGAYLRTLDCVHCGLCVPHCPTHAVTGREADSPRGRIHLLRAWAESRTELGEVARAHLDLCIVCRACESACPSGVRMGEMAESFRAHQVRAGCGGPMDSRLARFLLRRVLPRPRRVAFLAALLRAHQRTGMRRVADLLLPLVSKRLARIHRLQPTVPTRPNRPRPEADTHSAADPAARVGVVGLLRGCVAEDLFPRAHDATVRVLTRAGWDVVVPRAQSCCGAIHRHAGHADDATRLRKETLAAFTDAGVEAIVTNAAGCAAALAHPDPPIPVLDVFELLARAPQPLPLGELPVSVVHDAPCHLIHARGVDPGVVEDALRAIPALTLLPLPHADRCCGAGGAYHLLHAEMSDRVAAAKADAIVSTGASIVVTGNPGCAIQIAAALRRAGATGHRPVEVLHPVELVDRALAREG